MQHYEITFKEMCETPDWVIKDMVLLMEAEAKAEKDK